MSTDTAGNLFIADCGNARIRKVSADGIITTIAGNGKVGFSGDGGAATDASIAALSGIAVDGAGNVYFSNNDVIRILRPVTKLIASPIRQSQQK